MLKIKRAAGEKIHIQGGAEKGGVTIHVGYFNGGKVDLAFEADRSIHIVMAEKDDGRANDLQLPEYTPTKKKKPLRKFIGGKAKCDKKTERRKH